MTEHYLDHAATTPLHPGVLEAMLPYLEYNFGNPSSLHSFGRRARQGLSEARDTIAEKLGCASRQLVFTSSGTESDNLALIGLAKAMEPQGRKHIITTQIEHHAVLHACRQLENQGYEVTYLSADHTGIVNVADLAKALRPDTALVSVMYGNNEIGTLQPIEDMGRLCRDRGVYFHVDAVQALGAIPIRLGGLAVDLMSFSAHKINGPKGMGLLYSAPEVPLQPLMFGGSQERMKRPGTENVAGAAGFAQAVLIAADELQDKQQKMRLLRHLFIDTLIGEIGADTFVVNGHKEMRLDHILNISFPGIDKETMLMNLDLAGIAASGGSACTSGALEDSHVLQAMKLPQEVVKSSVRFSFGYGSTEKMIVKAAKIAGTIANRLRKP